MNAGKVGEVCHLARCDAGGGMAGLGYPPASHRRTPPSRCARPCEVANLAHFTARPATRHRRHSAQNFPPDFSTEISWMLQNFPCTAPVCVMRMNFAFAGANGMSVTAPLPLPSATGLLHVVPSLLNSTL